jgi:uncharacterized protein (TIGR02284 family)
MVVEQRCRAFEGDRVMAVANANHQEPNRAVIAALNRCVEACIDGEKGYGIAAADVRDPSLKTELIDRARERGEYAMTLQHLVEKLGAAAENQGTAAGALHRGWLDARLALEGRADATVLAEVVRGEAAALSVYENAIARAEQEKSGEEVRSTLQSQYAAMRRAYVELCTRFGAAK